MKKIRPTSNNNKGGLFLDLKLGVVILILITSVIMTACANISIKNNQSDIKALLEEIGSLTICSGDEVLGEVTLDQIKQLDSFKRSVTLDLSGDGGISHVFRGARLLDVLALVAPTLVDQYDSVTSVGVDDYLSQVTMDEVRMENNVFIAYEDNGEPIITKDGSGQGMRLVTLNDAYGMRFTKYLVVLDIGKQSEQKTE